MRIAVTGGNGKAGKAVVQELIDHGHRVRNVDLVADPDSVAGYREANLDDFGQHEPPGYPGPSPSTRLAANCPSRRRSGINHINATVT